MIKKVIKVIFFLIIVLLGIFLIRAGFYFEKISEPKNIYKNAINMFSDELINCITFDEKYNLGDTFNITGNIKAKINSDEYKNKAKIDVEYLKKLNMINNLSNMDTNYTISQDKKNKKAFIELDEKIGNETILHTNYLISDYTRYYYVASILQNYVNDGNNNYFEIFNEEKTTTDNINYLYDFIIDSISNRMADETKKYDSTVNINDKTIDSKQLSMRIDDKSIKNILNGLLDDLKKDKKANLIITSFDSDFPKRHIDSNKKYLSKKESYTLNIYTSKYINKPLKYEVIYLNKDSKKTYYYIGNNKKGDFYYLKDDEVRYTAKYLSKNKTIKINIFDRLNKESGSISLSKDINNIIFNMNTTIEDKKYDIYFSSKNKDYQKNKKYNNESQLSFNISKNNISELNGEIIASSTITNDVKIDVDVSNSILDGKLTDETRNKLDNLKDSVKNRIENNQ